MFIKCVFSINHKTQYKVFYQRDIIYSTSIFFTTAAPLTAQESRNQLISDSFNRLKLG